MSQLVHNICHSYNVHVILYSASKLLGTELMLSHIGHVYYVGDIIFFPDTSLLEEVISEGTDLGIKVSYSHRVA